MKCNYTIPVIVLFSILLSFSLSNLSEQASAQGDIFSMIEFESNFLTSLQLGENVISCIGLICTGTTQADTIIGSSLNEEISALESNDVVQGNDGDDVIYGGEGSDSIQGGGGLDNIFGGDGDDYIYADSSTSLSGTAIEDETAIVNRLNDRLLGIGTENLVSIDNLKVKENRVADIFILLNSNILTYSESYLDGGEGNDFLFGGSDNDIFKGGPGNDFFDCNEGIDHIMDFDPNEDTANVDCEILD